METKKGGRCGSAGGKARRKERGRGGVTRVSPSPLFRSLRGLRFPPQLEQKDGDVLGAKVAQRVTVLVPWCARRAAGAATEVDVAQGPKTKKAQRTGVRWAKMGDGCSPRTLSRSFALGALAFAGCKLPDATLHGMRRFRSHGGIAVTVAGRGLLSEASLPGSNFPCRERCAGQGADALARALACRHRGHGDGPGFWPGVGPV